MKVSKGRFLFFQFLFSGCVAGAALVLMEMIYRGGVAPFFYWVRQYPASAVYLLFLLFLFFLSLLLFNYKGFFLGAILSISFFSFLSFASFTKEKLRGDPLLPTDLKMVGEAKNMLQHFSTLSIMTWLGIFAAVLLFGGLVIFLFVKIKNHQGTRLFYLTSSAAVILLTGFVYQDLFLQNTVLKNVFAVQNHRYNQKLNYSENGVLLSFLRNTSTVSAEEPEHYSPEKMSALTGKLGNGKAAGSLKPNIIIVMSEAFWDPTVMKNVDFNKDPLPIFHKLAAGFTSGTVLTPVYGGSTSNTEFEVLTGMTNQFLPAGSVPYKSYLKKPVPALPNLLRSLGYETSAIHLYHNWFYDRNVIYRLLGFDRFISLEFFPRPVKDMMYYRDQELTDEVLKQLKISSAPDFIFAVTMQNHGPYPADRKKFYATMKADGKGLSSDGKNIVEFYADNLVQIDKELGRLIAALEKSNEKSIVVFFGDHLPLLGENYQVYREAGYFHDDQTFADYQKMYQTPILVWNNFGLKKEKLALSSSYIGPYVLDRAGQQGYYLTDFLNKLRKEGKSFFPRQDYLQYSSLSSNDVNTYRQLQYDLLQGKGYGLKNGANIKPSPHYRLGAADPHIDSYEKSNHQGKRSIFLKGSHFTTSSKVYINGKQASSIFMNENTIFAYVPKGIEASTIVLKIYDNKGNLLANSNKVAIK